MAPPKRPPDYQALLLGPTGERGLDEWAKAVRLYLADADQEEALAFARLLLRQVRDSQLSTRLELVLQRHSMVPSDINRRTERIELLRLVEADLAEFITETVAQQREVRERMSEEAREARDAKRYFRGMIVDVVAMAAGIAAVLVALKALPS